MARSSVGRYYTKQKQRNRILARMPVGRDAPLPLLVALPAPFSGCSGVGQQVPFAPARLTRAIYPNPPNQPGEPVPFWPSSVTESKHAFNNRRTLYVVHLTNGLASALPQLGCPTNMNVSLPSSSISVYNMNCAGSARLFRHSRRWLPCNGNSRRCLAEAI